MRVLVHHAVFILLCFACRHAAAQDNDIYTSYGINEGLPQSTVWSLTQDRNGFLWAATSDGACRFDGYNFTVYRNDPKDSTSIIGGAYITLYTDNNGMLWAISPNGVCIYNDVKDNFTTVFSYRQQYAAESYNCFFGEDKDYIWAGISSYGILKINKRSHEASVITKTDYQKSSSFLSWQGGFVSDGRVWICDISSVCYVFDISTGTLHKPDLPNIYSLANLNDSESLAATAKGLIIINKHTFRSRTEVLNLPVEDRVKVIFKNNDNEVLLGTGYGLIYLNTQTWKVSRQVRSFARNKKQSFSNVQCIYKDNTGNLWIGTNGDGLKKLAAPHKKFRLYSSYNDSSNLVKAVYADKNNLYVGYFGGGLDLFDRERGFIKNIPLKAPERMHKHIFALTAADSNTLVMNNGDQEKVYAYRLSDGKFRSLSALVEKVLPGSKKLLNNNPFLLNTGDTIYTGISDYLISLDVSVPGKIMPGIAHHIAGEMLTCAFKDNAGRLWAGSINGAFYIAGGKHRQIALPEVVTVKSINQDLNGNIWIGTVKGIYVIDGNNQIVRHYTEENGLSNRFVYGILRDDDGNMWFSHNKGLSVYNTKTEQLRHYTYEDGLQSNEFNTGAYFKAADGTLFFGGIYGTNAFNPREINHNPHPPRTRITSIRLFDMPMKTETAYWHVAALTLPYDQNNLGFEFAALEFTNPKQNQYAYIMEGLDKDWIPARDKRFTRYAGIPPGQYTFKVKASNDDGVWQEVPAMISITIVAPYWQQLWFRALILLMSISFIVLIILRIQKQRHQRKMRANELQQKIQMERERISRDLHDNVGTQLSLISNNIDWVVHPLKAITETEQKDKLFFVSQTAKDIIATLRETIWALNKEEIRLEEFSDKLKAFVLKQSGTYDTIDLKFLEQLTEPIILGPAEALDLFRICQEAIANALKYSTAKNITVNIASANGRFKITIADDGRGFDPGKVNRSVQNGLENMKYRAENIGSELEIITFPGNGTTVVIAKK